MALALFAVACEDEEETEPETFNNGQTEQGTQQGTYDDDPYTGDQPFQVEGTPTSPPEGWPPGSPYVVGNTQNPDGTFTPVFNIVPGEQQPDLPWQEGVDPQGHQTAIVNGQLHVLHPYDSDGDGFYDTMSHYRPPAQGSPGNPSGFVPDFYVPPVQTGYRPPPPPQTPALSTPAWFSPSCVVFGGETQLFYRWTDISGAEWYEIEGNFQLAGSPDLTEWSWIGFTPQTTMTLTGEAEQVRAKVRAAASGNRLSLWSAQRLLLCEELAAPTATLDCIGTRGAPQTLRAGWRAADGRSAVSTPVQWRIDGPDGTREGTGAAGSLGEFVDVGIEPDGYWRDYTLSVQLTVNGIAVLDPGTAQARCDGTEPPLPSNLSVVCTAPQGGAPLVDVSWDAPTGITATGYEAEGDLAYSGAGTSFSRTGDHGQSYTVRVRATDGTYTTGWTANETGECPPAVPANLDVSCSADGTLLTVSWDADPLAASFEAVEDGGDLFPYSGAANSFTRTSAVGDSYTWQVRSIASGGRQSDWSVPVTGDCSLIPPTPTNIAMTCVGPPTGTQTLTVTWDPPPGNPQYDIWYNYGNPANWDADPNNDEPATISNRGQTPANRTRSHSVSVTLPAPANQEGRLYTVRVQAESTAGTSDWSSKTGVHDPFAWVRCPGKPPAPAEAAIGAQCFLLDNRIEVEWDDIADKAAGDAYSYQVRSDEGDSFTNSPPEWTDPGSGTESVQTVAVWDDKGNGIQVRATNIWGSGPWSPATGIDLGCRVIPK